jgi:hypothetical protein
MPSTASSQNSVADANSQPGVKIFSPDGVDRSCKVNTSYAESYGYPTAVITLSERGRSDRIRTLKVCRLSYVKSNVAPKRASYVGDKWYSSVVKGSFHNPAGDLRIPTLPKTLDPGHLIYLYKGNLDYLEVLVNPQTDKWMLRPIAAGKRAALSKAQQAARTASKKAESKQMSSMLKSVKTAESNKPRRLAASQQEAEAGARRSSSLIRLERQESEGSQSSILEKKDIGYSVRPVATNDTSTTTKQKPRHGGLFGRKA